MTTNKITVPMHGDPAATTSRPPPNFHYGGGPLLTSVQVFTIFWGKTWVQAPQNALITQLNKFFDSILGSSLIDLLSEYSVPGETIGHGKRIGSVTVTNSEPGGGSGNVTDAQVQLAIEGWIKNGTIPNPNPDTFYFVYLPSHVSATDPNGIGSCQGMCGYHWFISNTNPEVHYALVPLPECSGCLGGLTQIQALTTTSSHELCEGITDPHPGTGWYGKADGEIGDVCSWQTAIINGFTVQKEWSVLESMCDILPAYRWRRGDLTSITGAPNAAGEPHGYAFESQGNAHVVFRSIDGHVHELFWDKAGWHHGDLTSITGAPNAAGEPHGYAFESQGNAHVIFRSVDGHVHELFWDKVGWHHGDLTTITGAPKAVGDPHGYEFKSQGNAHVVYRSADGHVHELFWDKAGWHHGDLTSITGAPNAANDPHGYAFESQGNAHVIYRSADGHVQELFWDKLGWHHGDLTNIAGAPNAVGAPDGYEFKSQGDAHVVYRSADGHVHELFWDKAGWHHGDLTSITGAPNAANDPHGYAFESRGNAHVVYRSADGHVHELFWDKAGWHHGDLTNITGAPNAVGAPNGYEFKSQANEHVVYRGADGHVYELWWGA